MARKVAGVEDISKGPVREKRFIDRNGEPTDEQFYEEPDPTDPEKTVRRPNLIRPPSTHGTIARDPNANLDRASAVVGDAALREVKSEQPSQAGEDPGRVFDAAGLNSRAAALHKSNPSNPVTGGVPHMERAAAPQRPVDSPETTARLASEGATRKPVAGPDRFTPPQDAPNLTDASRDSLGRRSLPGDSLPAPEFDADRVGEEEDNEEDLPGETVFTDPPETYDPALPPVTDVETGGAPSAPAPSDEQPLA